MAIDDNTFVTICPLAYTDIEIHYQKQGFATTYQAIDNLWNSLTQCDVTLYNDSATDVKAATIWWYEFDHWEFTDNQGCRRCVSDNPISLKTCRTE